MLWFPQQKLTMKLIPEKVKGTKRNFRKWWNMMSDHNPLFLHLPPSFCATLMCSSEKETGMLLLLTKKSQSFSRWAQAAWYTFVSLASQQLWRTRWWLSAPWFQPGIFILSCSASASPACHFLGHYMALSHKCLQVLFKSRVKML